MVRDPGTGRDSRGCGGAQGPPGWPPAAFGTQAEGHAQRPSRARRTNVGEGRTRGSAARGLAHRGPGGAQPRLQPPAPPATRPDTALPLPPALAPTCCQRSPWHSPGIPGTQACQHEEEEEEAGGGRSPPHPPHAATAA